MHDSIEADLLAAHRVPFSRDRAAWVDAYVNSASRLDPKADRRRLAAAADSAWGTHFWAHPAIVAYLDSELGPLQTE